MIFGVPFYNELDKALNEACNQRRQELQKSITARSPAIWINIQKEQIDFISQFRAKLHHDLNIKSVLELTKDAPRIFELVFKKLGHTKDNNPALNKIKEMLNIFETALNNSPPKVYAAEQVEGKIKSDTLDELINYTAITPKSTNNNREQFLIDYNRGFMISDRLLTNLPKEQLLQTVREFLNIKEPHPRTISDPVKKMQYDFIINTGQEVFSSLLLDVNNNMTLNGNPVNANIDSKSRLFNWRKEDDKIFLSVQIDTKVLSTEESQFITCTATGDIEVTDNPENLNNLANRPSLTSHHFEAELIVKGPGTKHAEAKLEMRNYDVLYHKDIEYKPDMKNYDKFEPGPS